MTTPNLSLTSTRPVKALTPTSDGRLFPERNQQDNQKHEEAVSMLVGLQHATAFRAHPNFRAANARPFGPFPGEDAPRRSDEALVSLNESFLDARRAASDGDYASSRKSLEKSLGTLHTLTTHRDAPGTVAPLHSWLPEEVHLDVLARLTFSYAEMSREEDQQRTAIHFLDLMREELPDPTKGEPTSTQQRLLRMLTHIYMGRALDRSRTVQEAIKQYETALSINDLHEKGIEETRLVAHAELIDLRCKRALKLFTEHKTERFGAEIDKILELRASIENKLSLEAPHNRRALLLLRQELARRLWGFGLVDKAHRELYGTYSKYGSSEGATLFKELIEGTTTSAKRRSKLYARFITPDGKLKHPEQLSPLPWHERMWLRITQTLKNARRPAPKSMFAGWILGSTAFAGAAYAISAGNASAADLLVSSGAGAAIVDGAQRLFIGANSPQTKAAAVAGYSDVSPTRALRATLGFAANTAIPYALFGGPLPGLGALEGAPVLHHLVEPTTGSTLAAGSLYGPGVFVSSGVSSLAHEIRLIQLSTLSEYINRLGKSTLATTIAAATDYWLGLAASIVNGSLFAKAGNTMAEWTRNANGWALGLKAYEAASVGYLLGYRTSGGFRTLVNNNRVLKALGPALIPGGLLAGADVGVALGANPGYTDIGPFTVPLNMVGTAAVGAVYQVLGQTLIGNRRLRDIQWGNVLSAAAVINLYVGASSNFNPVVASSSFGQMVEESIGRQIGMIPIILAHGAMLMVDPRRFAENKVARLLFYDHFGNVTRIALGPWDGFLPVLAGVSVGFFGTNTLLGRTFNDLAGSRPAALSMATQLEAANGVASNRFLRAFSRSLRRIPPSAPFTKMSTETLAIPAKAFYDSLISGKKLCRYMIPEEKTYRMIHDMLMGEGVGQTLTTTQVATLISATNGYLNRPDDADIARGLSLTLWAARQGPHAEQIEAFFGRNRDVFTRLRIDRDLPELPSSRSEKERALWNHLQHPYRVCPEEMGQALGSTNLPQAVAPGAPMHAPLMSRVAIGALR